MTTETETGSSAGLPFRQIINAIWRRKGLVLALTAAGTLLVGVAAFSMSPRFTAVAEIVVGPAGGAATLGGGKAAAVGPDESVIDTQIAMLTSQSQLCGVLEALSNRPDFGAAAARGTDAPPTGLQAVRATVAAALKSVRALLPARAPAERDECGRASGAPGPRLSDLKAGLKIYQQRRSFVIAVSYTGENPAQAAIIADTIVQRHVAQQSEARRGQVARVVQWLDERIAFTMAARDEADAAIRQERLAGGPDPTETDSLRPLIEARRLLAITRSELAQRQATLSRARAMQQGGADATDLAALLGIAAAQEGPASRSADNIGEAIRRLTGEVQFSRMQAQAISDQIDALQQGMADVAGERTSRAALEQRSTALARLLDDLQRRREESIQDRDLATADVGLFTLAQTPNRSSSISPMLLLPPGVLAFFLLGAVFAITWDRLDRSFRNERDVSHALRIPCIGLIPELSPARPGARKGRWPADMRPSYRQAVRSVLVAALELARPARERKVVLVTSSVPREGASTLARSLGYCAARLGQRVLLIDLGHEDSAAAIISQCREEGSGAVSIVANNAAVDTIRQGGSQGYDYLSAAELGVDLLGFLVSPHGQQLFLKLRRTYDCIFIDGPPVLAAPETRILAAVADTVLLAVHWGETRREVAANAIELLRRSGLTDGEPRPRLEAVLTRANLSAHARYRYGDAAELLITYDRPMPRPNRAASPSRWLDRPSHSGPRRGGLFAALRRTSHLWTDPVDPG